MAHHPLPDPREQFPEVVDDEKLRLTLAAYADALDERHRQLIYKAYTDDKLHALYRGIRDSGIYANTFGKQQRKILSFPTAPVYRFVDTTMTALYGPNWLEQRQALLHDLVRPWLVVPVNKL